MNSFASFVVPFHVHGKEVRRLVEGGEEHGEADVENLSLGCVG